MRLLCEGKTNSEIAAKLHVAESSVRTYINRMLEKTGYSNRNRLMVAAVGKRLVVPGNQLDDCKRKNLFVLTFEDRRIFSFLL